eukprot:GHVR01025818.1.p1 GENE.GHVR01025818.1~~GHVR01025818.1.p1  ORF type:complete len:225 (+),score=71.75 GHVR01025818.1:79-753(+)
MNKVQNKTNKSSEEQNNNNNNNMNNNMNKTTKSSEEQSNKVINNMKKTNKSSERPRLLRDLTCIISTSYVALIEHPSAPDWKDGLWMLKFIKHTYTTGYKLDANESLVSKETFLNMKSDANSILTVSGVLGLIRFLEGYYLILVTSRHTCARLEGCLIEQIKATRMVKLFYNHRSTGCCGGSTVTPSSLVIDPKDDTHTPIDTHTHTHTHKILTKTITTITKKK